MRKFLVYLFLALIAIGIPTIKYHIEEASRPVTMIPNKESLPTKLVTIESGYYIQGVGENAQLVKVSGFAPYQISLVDIPLTSEMFIQESLLPSDLKAMYCSMACLEFYNTQGDPLKYYQWVQNIKFYWESADGTFAQLAVVAPPEPTRCEILGVYIDENDNLFVKFQDFDGEEKMSVWHLSSTGVSEVDTIDFVEQSFDFADYYIDTESFAALTGHLKVEVFDTGENRLIGEALPCAAG